MELEALQTALADIQRLGASVVAISSQLERYGRSIHRRLNLAFDVLTDRGLQVAGKLASYSRFPIYLKTVYVQFGNKLDEFHGENAFRLPMPARYVIDQQSVIRSANVSSDYTIRPEPSETINTFGGTHEAQRLTRHLGVRK